MSILRPSILPSVLALLLLLAGPGCTRLGLIKSAEARLVSLEETVRLSPDFRVLVYAEDEGGETADLYFTDLTDEELEAFFDDSGAWTELAGSLVHVHVFLKPYAGRTPIEPTAANASVRWAVLARGEIGVYTGGGFVLPARRIAGSNLAGNLSGGTVRLTRATPGFHDSLGPAKLTMGFTAERDPETTEMLTRSLNAAARRATLVADAVSE